MTTRRDYVFIGSSPAAEDCAQVGAPNYYELNKLELKMFKEAIIAKLGPPPEGAELGIKDGEVICYYDNEAGATYANKCESEAPQTWEEAGMKAPRLDDPAFTETELIPVPEKRTTQKTPPETCNLHGTTHQSRGCVGAIKNEFFDASLNLGTWADVCPACFGVYGQGVGTGRGQHYKKATDGKFYKVE